MSNPYQPSPVLLQLAELALRAGAEVMSVYGKDFAASAKKDSTPVTEADLRSERVILEGLARLDSATPVISEEAAAAGSIPETAERFYLVDPLDGTKEFISRNGEFTINIALIEAGVPIMGVVLAPALERMFIGEKSAGAAESTTSVGEMAWRPIEVRKKAPPRLAVVASRSHRDERTDAFLDSLGPHNLVSAGSSLKFCLLAAGEADLYPRFGRTMEWDTAAGHAVLLAAGGIVVTETGEVLTYGKTARGYDNPAFIAASGPKLLPFVNRMEASG
jgi:3'(2'), 5'-bisphosphate nucleotidase